MLELGNRKLRLRSNFNVESYKRKRQERQEAKTEEKTPPFETKTSLDKFLDHLSSQDLFVKADTYLQERKSNGKKTNETARHAAETAQA